VRDRPQRESIRQTHPTVPEPLLRALLASREVIADTLAVAGAYFRAV
jgi:hypothetical protein